MINLTNNWRINNESLPGLSLQQKIIRKKKDTQEEYLDWRDEGYYDTLQGAFRGFLKYYTNSATSFENVLERIIEIKAALQKTVDAFNDFNEYLQDTSNKKIEKKLDLIINKLSPPNYSNSKPATINTIDAADTIEIELNEIKKLKDKNGSVN